MFGVLKNVAIPSSRLIKAMENRCTIDTASLDGFTGEEENDLYLKPDLSTFSILPWRPQQGKVARFLCDVCREDGTEIEDSPRSIPEKSSKKSTGKRIHAAWVNRNVNFSCSTPMITECRQR